MRSYRPAVVFLKTGFLTYLRVASSALCSSTGVRPHAQLIILCVCVCVVSEGAIVLYSLQAKVRGQPSEFGPHLLTYLEIASPSYC